MMKTEAIEDDEKQVLEKNLDTLSAEITKPSPDEEKVKSSYKKLNGLWHNISVGVQGNAAYELLKLLGTLLFID